MSLELREGGHHLGNWGGLLANPGVIMANALASMIDQRGQILVDGWKAPPMTDTVRTAIGEVAPVCGEALGIMAGLWWDLGSGDTP